MSDAGKKGPIIEPTTSTWTYTCIHDCRKTIQFDIEREAKPPRDRDFEIDQIEQGLFERGWVTKRLVDNDDRTHVFAYCSLACHNQQVRENETQKRKDWWWIRARGLYGDPPKCSCPLVEDGNGFLGRQRDTDCAWHAWGERYDARRDERERELFEQWKDIPIGTIVVDQRTGRASRVKAPPKILQHSFGCISTVVPVEAEGIHPRALDLEIPRSGDWRWLPPLKGETPNDRKSKDAPD